MFDTQVTVVGNLVAEPRLALTKDGQPVASFRLASTPRRFDRVTGEWKDGDTLFTSVTCWRALAENVSASLKKGSSVIVLGRLSVRPYETKDGDKRQSVDIDAIAVGPELGRVITLIKRAERAVPAAQDARLAGEPAGTDDFASVGLPGDSDDEDGDEVTPGATDWGVSLGEPFDAPSGQLGADVPYMDEDGTGPAIDLTAGPGAGAEMDGLVEPVPAQLASTGGRWRSRSAG
jgi:single-strand DNA-binding protein